MNNQNLSPQLPAGAKTLIEKYKPIFKDENISQCTAHPDHNSIYGDPKEGLAMLVASMEEVGQTRIIVTRPMPDGTEQIIDGARIWSAAKYLGWVDVSIASLTSISEQEVIPLMNALNSNHRRFSYKIAAKKLISTEENAKKLLQQNKLDGNASSDETVRQHVAKVLGFKSERHVSDLKHIINSPDCNILLEQMDQGRLKLNKAVKIAKGSIDMPTPKPKTKKGNIQVFTCPDCPRRAEFLKMLDEEDAGNTNNTDDDNANEPKIDVTPEPPIAPTNDIVEIDMEKEADYE